MYIYTCMYVCICIYIYETYINRFWDFEYDTHNLEPHRFRAKRDQLKRFEDCGLDAKARIWPCLSYICYLRSTAAC